jgi:succinoglycan biosynthesis transport protein ExoP
LRSWCRRGWTWSRLKLSARLGVLETEQSLGNGRLTIISTAEVPLSPDKDLRPALAAAGGLTGALLPALFFFLRYQLTRRVYHYSDETEVDVQSGIPLLGILPVLAEAKGDREQAISAAHSVHQIRVSLSAQTAPGNPTVYLVTSAAAGEGKTSVTMSLALSFVASRARTLVIDGDLIGRRFTQNLDGGELEGLHEALSAGSMSRLVRHTDSGVAVLTTGKGSTRDACGIGREKMRVLIAQARGHFDVVLIDTGPILGSVEAAVLAQEVDSVIFTIARGQRRTLVEHSLRRLRMLGVRTAGIIFNRANASDFNRSPYGSSYYSPSTELADKPGNDLSRLRSLERFGPMVKAVAAGVPASQN